MTTQKQVIKKAYTVILLFLFVMVSVIFVKSKKIEGNLFSAGRFLKVLDKTKYFGINVIEPIEPIGPIEPRKKRKITSQYLNDFNNILDPFFEKLQQLENKQNNDNVKIMFFGTSSIGFDRVTSRMRHVLQPIFGNGGKGFVPATKGWLYHRHKDVIWSFSDSWQYQSVTNHIRHKHTNGYYGLGGVLSMSNGKSWIKYKTKTPFSKLSVFYRKHKRGALVNIYIDEKKHELNTYSQKAADDIFVIDVKEGAYNVKIESDTKQLHIYGVALDKKQGLIIDALMYIGVYVHQLLYFDKEHISNMIAERKPNLLIFNMGDKDVGSNPSDEKINNITQSYIDAVSVFKSKVKNVPCLIISVKDMGEKIMGKVVTKSCVPKMVEQSKIVAEKTGCAFFNIFEAMGGEGTMEKWRMASPKLVSKDLGHLFNSGATKIGDIVSNMLMEEYNQYKKQDKNLQ